MTTDTCKCGRPISSGGAKGQCPRCYQRARRLAAGMTPRAHEIAAPGEGDEVTFRLPRAEKEGMAALASEVGLDCPSELYRRAVRLLLARPALARKR